MIIGQSRELQNIYVFPSPSSFCNQNIKVKVNSVHNSENQGVNVIVEVLGSGFLSLHHLPKDNSVDITPVPKLNHGFRDSVSYV